MKQHHLYSNGAVSLSPPLLANPSLLNLLSPLGNGDAEGQGEGARKRPLEGFFPFFPILEKKKKKQAFLDPLSACVLPASLGLALNQRLHSFGAPPNALRAMPDSTLFSSIGDSLNREIKLQKDEIDVFLKLQGEQMSKAIAEKRQRHTQALVSRIEASLSEKLEEREREIGKMARQNLEVEERLKVVMQECQAWQRKAKCNAAMVTALRANLEQAVRLSREGSGESQVEEEDAASSHFRGAVQANKEPWLCRACGTLDVSILLLPCRHLCLCKDCEGSLQLCPICASCKSASIQVYLS